MTRRSIYIIALLFLVIAAVAVTNYVLLQRHLAMILETDPRNKGIEARAHYGLYLMPSILVFDLKAVSPTNSQADVSRVLLQFAQSQKEKSFVTVKLAHRGTAKFQLTGDYFRTLGQEYGVQNPIYTMRTFSENVNKLDGSPAFGTWTGGLLGVMTKQMEDLSEFHKQWYMADLLKSGS